MWTTGPPLAAALVVGLLGSANAASLSSLFHKDEAFGELVFPEFTECPATANSSVTIVNKNSTLLPEESAWVKGRQANVDKAWAEYLTRLGANASDYPQPPRVAIATSGGGYRAMLNGAGVVKALDSRTSKFLSAGILDIATYWAGLSGGNWIAGSMYFHGFPTIDEWATKINIQDNMMLPGYGNGDRKGKQAVANNYEILTNYGNGKAAAGFPVTLTDYWSGLITYAILNWTADGLAYQLSDLANTPAIANHTAPLPFLVSLEVKPNQANALNNSNPFEWGVFGSGSYSNNVTALMNTSLVGSVYNDSAPVNSTACALGFDTLQFVMGTSSSAFLVSVPVNTTNATNETTATTTEEPTPTAELSTADKLDNLFKDVLKGLVEGVLKVGADLLVEHSFLSDAIQVLGGSIQKPTVESGGRLFDPAIFANPFEGDNASGVSDQEQLYLVDGGLSLLNIPLQPLYVPAREVDVIFAVDSSADYDSDVNGTTAHLPNGTAMVAQAVYMKGEGWAFPEIPTEDQFTECNYYRMKRVTFFGCNSTDSPVLVYIPNRLMLDTDTAFSTYKMQYTDEEKNSTIENGYQQLNDEDTNRCIGCLLMHRSNITAPVTAACQKCLDDYCWTPDTPKPDPCPATPAVNGTAPANSTETPAPESASTPIPTESPVPTESPSPSSSA